MACFHEATPRKRALLHYPFRVLPDSRRIPALAGDVFCVHHVNKESGYCHGGLWESYPHQVGFRWSCQQTDRVEVRSLFVLHSVSDSSSTWRPTQGGA